MNSTKLRKFSIGILVVTLTFFSLCYAQKAKRSGVTKQKVTKKKERLIKMDDKLFLNVPLNRYEKNACSPAKPDNPGWRGIIIQAPAKVAFKRGIKVGNAFAAIPICGIYQADVPFPLEPDVLRIIVTDKRNGKVYSGPIVELDPSPSLPDPDPVQLTKEQVAGLASGRYFNPNVADFVDLPIEPNVYEVMIELRGLHSNIVVIELVEGELK